MKRLRVLFNVIAGIIWGIFLFVGNLELVWMLLIPSIYALILMIFGGVPVFPRGYNELLIFSAKIHIRLFAQPVPSNFLGFFLSILSFFLFVFAFHQRIRDGLAKEGLYAWSRHPQYTALIIFTFGLLIIQPTFVSIACWLLLLLFYIQKSKNEEAIMTTKYGDEYIVYKKSAPRFLYTNPLKSIAWSFKRSTLAGIVVTFFALNVVLTCCFLVLEIFKLTKGQPLTMTNGPRMRLETNKGALIWDPHDYNEKIAWEIALNDSNVLAFQKKSEDEYGGKGYTFVEKKKDNLITLEFFPDAPSCGYTGNILQVTVDHKEGKVIRAELKNSNQ